MVLTGKGRLSKDSLSKMSCLRVCQYLISMFSKNLKHDRGLNLRYLDIIGGDIND